ncbi:MAG: glycosyltransferase family 39 protein [Bacteroidales bacterium]
MNGLEHVKENKYWLVAFLLIVVKLCLHFFTNTNYELHRDEMLYFNMADHLDWGYASVPPFIGLMAFLSKAIFGYSVFGIRFFPALMGAGSMFIMARIIHRLGGGIFSLVIALSSFLLSTGFLLIGSLFTPNAFEQFSWLLIIWYLFKMTSDNNPKLWIWIGIFIGLSFLNKYSVVFLAAGFVVALLLSPYRKMFYSRYFIVAIIIALMIVSPNIYWQYAHNWPVVFHMKELQSTQLVNMKTIDFLKDVFTLNLISTAIWLFGLYALLFSPTEKDNRYLGIGSFIIILLFLFSSGKGYYIMGIIPFLFAYGGYAMEKLLLQKVWPSSDTRSPGMADRPASQTWGPGMAGRLIGNAVLAVSMVISLLAIPYALPVMSFDKLSRYTDQTGHLIIYPFYRWEDGKVHSLSQVYADMTGWQELTSYVAKAYKGLPEEEQKKCTIFGERNYGYAGAIHFYGKQYGLPDAVTFQDSYALWAPDSIPSGPIIYMYYGPGELNNLYQSVVEVGCVNNPWFREKGLKVFLCTHAKTNVPAIYSQLVSNAKVVYRR